VDLNSPNNASILDWNKIISSFIFDKDIIKNVAKWADKEDQASSYTPPKLNRRSKQALVLRNSEVHEASDFDRCLRFWST
jgi:hypothetical protein